MAIHNLYPDNKKSNLIVASASDPNQKANPCGIGDGMGLLALLYSGMGLFTFGC
jgi:hypothetical protein